MRLARGADCIADEIVQHLTTQKNATAHLIPEIEADTPDGARDTIVRVVTGSARTLRFNRRGFEEEWHRTETQHVYRRG